MTDWGDSTLHSVCLEADDVVFVESILQISDNAGRTFRIVTDCNN